MGGLIGRTGAPRTPNRSVDIAGTSRISARSFEDEKISVTTQEVYPGTTAHDFKIGERLPVETIKVVQDVSNPNILG